MMEADLSTDKHSAEFKFADGCPSCGGNVQVRVSAGGTWGYCAACHYLARTFVRVEGETLRLQTRPAGNA